MSILLALNGVLRTEQGDPIPEGLKLYRSLVPNYRIIIASDSNMLVTEHWMRTNFLVGHADILDNSYAYEGMDLRERQLQYARTQGVIEMLIDSNADRCAHAVSVGVAAMYFASPRFAPAKREIKSWEDLSTTVIKQREKVAESYAQSINKSLFDEVD